ncbi:MAG: SH3 domain-containing protein [Alphaproteobacteria bacterium]
MSAEFGRTAGRRHGAAIALALALASCVATSALADSLAPREEGLNTIQTPDGDGGSDTTAAVGSVAEDVALYDSPRPMYATTSARVRSGPSTDFDPVGTIPYAALVSVLGQAPSSGWLYVEMADGSRGFTAAHLLSENRPSTTTGPATTDNGSTVETGATPVCVGGQVLIRMGDGRSICATLQ